uniref:PAX3-and PAX7-binding protein 1 n=1 Tax=Macrostomum lignano TaxID=282301 RepID=A0A1I8IWH5_9PLAT
QQHQHQPTPVPPFAVAVRESVAAASRTKQRRRSSSVGDLSKELEKFELQLQQLQEHLPAKDCSIVIDKPVESQRARAVTVEQCGPAQNTNFPSSGLASPDTLSEYRYRPREALELFHKKPPISAKAFASQSKRLLQQQQQKTSDSMITRLLSPVLEANRRSSHESGFGLAWKCAFMACSCCCLKLVRDRLFRHSCCGCCGVGSTELRRPPLPPPRLGQFRSLPLALRRLQRLLCQRRVQLAAQLTRGAVGQDKSVASRQPPAADAAGEAAGMSRRQKILPCRQKQLVHHSSEAEQRQQRRQQAL